MNIDSGHFTIVDGTSQMSNETMQPVLDAVEKLCNPSARDEGEVVDSTTLDGSYPSTTPLSNAIMRWKSTASSLYASGTSVTVSGWYQIAADIYWDRAGCIKMYASGDSGEFSLCIKLARSTGSAFSVAVDYLAGNSFNGPTYIGYSASDSTDGAIFIYFPTSYAITYEIESDTVSVELTSASAPANTLALTYPTI